MKERYIYFLGKGSLILANQVQEQRACWVLFSIFSPSWKEIVSHGPSHLKHNSIDGQINKQTSRRPWKGGVWNDSQMSLPEQMQLVKLCHPSSSDAKCVR